MKKFPAHGQPQSILQTSLSWVGRAFSFLPTCGFSSRDCNWDVAKLPMFRSRCSVAKTRLLSADLVSHYLCWRKTSPCASGRARDALFTCMSSFYTSVHSTHLCWVLNLVTDSVLSSGNTQMRGMTLSLGISQSGGHVFTIPWMFVKGMWQHKVNRDGMLGKGRQVHCHRSWALSYALKLSPSSKKWEDKTMPGRKCLQKVYLIKDSSKIYKEFNEQSYLKMGKSLNQTLYQSR